MSRIHHLHVNDCPRCGATRGQPCTTPSGVKTHAHVVRPRGLILADLTPRALEIFEASGADPFDTEVTSPTSWVVGRNPDAPLDPNEGEN